MNTPPRPEHALQDDLDEIQAMQNRLRVIGRTLRERGLHDADTAAQDAHAALQTLWARIAGAMPSA